MKRKQRIWNGSSVLTEVNGYIPVLTTYQKPYKLKWLRPHSPELRDISPRDTYYVRHDGWHSTRRLYPVMDVEYESVLQRSLPEVMLVEAPYCCTARMIVDLGGDENTEGETNEAPVEYIRERVRKHIYLAREDGLGLLISFLTSDQTAAREALLAEGFQEVSSSTKYKHQETTLHLYSYELETGE